MGSLFASKTGRVNLPICLPARPPLNVRSNRHSSNRFQLFHEQFFHVFIIHQLLLSYACSWQRLSRLTYDVYFFQGSVQPSFSFICWAGPGIACLFMSSRFLNPKSSYARFWRHLHVGSSNGKESGAVQRRNLSHRWKEWNERWVQRCDWLLGRLPAEHLK